MTVQYMFFSYAIIRHVKSYFLINLHITLDIIHIYLKQTLNMNQDYNRRESEMETLKVRKMSNHISIVL